MATNDPDDFSWVPEPVSKRALAAALTAVQEVLLAEDISLTWIARCELLDTALSSITGTDRLVMPGAS